MSHATVLHPGDTVQYVSSARPTAGQWRTEGLHASDGPQAAEGQWDQGREALCEGPAWQPEAREAAQGFLRPRRPSRNPARARRETSPRETGLAQAQPSTSPAGSDRRRRGEGEGRRRAPPPHAPTHPSAGRRPPSPGREPERSLRPPPWRPPPTRAAAARAAGQPPRPGLALPAADPAAGRHGGARPRTPPAGRGNSGEALPDAAKLCWALPARAPPPGRAPSPLATAARPGRASGYLNVHRVPAQHTSHGVRTATAFPRLPAVPEWSGAEPSAGGGGAASPDSNAQVGGHPPRRARAGPGQVRPGGLRGRAAPRGGGVPGPARRRGQGSRRFTSGPRRAPTATEGRGRGSAETLPRGFTARSPRWETALHPQASHGTAVAPPLPKGREPWAPAASPWLAAAPLAWAHGHLPCLGARASFAIMLPIPLGRRGSGDRAKPRPGCFSTSWKSHERSLHARAAANTTVVRDMAPLLPRGREALSQGCTYTFSALLAWTVPEPSPCSLQGQWAFPPPASPQESPPTAEATLPQGVPQRQAGQVTEPLCCLKFLSSQTLRLFNNTNTIFRVSLE